VNIRAFKNLLKPLLNTPFHPQWLLTQSKNKTAEYIKSIGSDKTVLDVGCFNKWPRQLLPENCNYIGLDYFETATDWYGSVPDVFGDACHLPIQTSAIDVVLLLDVLEHLPSAEDALCEISRVLRPGGSLIVQIPFLYPLHDEPRDYSRLTHYGFAALANKHGLDIERCNAQGVPIETAALLTNIAITKVVFGWIAQKKPAVIFSVLAPIIILLVNLFAKGINGISQQDDFMPYSYQLVAKKRFQ
jgi:SAM-dependent methyltransferase